LDWSPTRNLFCSAIEGHHAVVDGRELIPSRIHFADGAEYHIVKKLTTCFGIEMAKVNWRLWFLDASYSGMFSASRTAGRLRWNNIYPLKY
jgi:hypothetical protein